jgi:hypothetical protein
MATDRASGAEHRSLLRGLLLDVPLDGGAGHLHRVRRKDARNKPIALPLR